MMYYKRVGSLFNLVSNYALYKRVCNVQFKQSIFIYSIKKRNYYLSTVLNANIPFCLTDIGEGIREVTVKEWFVKEGDHVSEFDNICEVQSDKASVTITSRYDGIIKKLYYKINETACVGQPLVDIETAEESDKRSKNKQTTNTNDSTNNDISTREEQENKITVTHEDTSIEGSQNLLLCIPSVRRLAKEKNVDLSKVKPTGKGGRILKEDVLKYLQSISPITVSTLSQENKKEEVVQLQGFQSAMVKTMTAALKIPHFVYSDEIAVTKLIEFLRLLKKDEEEIGFKITVTAFLVKAISNALRKHPSLNSSFDVAAETITIKHYHNIGVAMDTPQGLAVPVIKNVESRNIRNIAQELHRLMQNGKKRGTFAIEDVTGGTFTISNIGNIGGTYMSPVILPPQVAIIAFGKIMALPRFNEKDELTKEHIVNVSGAADHRIVDGATMAHFISTVKRQIENLHLLLINN